jgi:putative DNA primase/helicase
MDDFDDRFEPLTESELAAGVTAENEGEDWTPLVPVPQGIRLPDSFVKLCCPADHTIRSAWRYPTPDGGYSSFVVRYNKTGTDDKEFLPFTFCENAAGKRKWRCKALPAPRPLYGLDMLAGSPGAPVVICEGEKSANAAALTFPKSVCVTSPGGSQAAAKANFEPLAGRRVLIWPDADEPGEKYAGEVARILHGLRCEVSLIDAEALASMAPDGGQREPVKGWDAANAKAEWKDHAALRKAALGLAKPFEAGPEFVSWGPFKMDVKGLTTEVTKGKGDNATTETIWIASAFEVIGACRDPNGRSWGKWLRWKDRDRRIHTRHATDAALQGDPASLCAMLADEGLTINKSQQRAFATYLSGCNAIGRVTIVHRTGWHEIGNHQIFVVPSEVIGPTGSERVILDASATGPYETRGTLKDWQDGIGALSSGHALPVLAISAAFAGPLLHLAGQEGGGVNFFGRSSQGKTTIVQAAASVWGRGASPGYVRAWRATANGLEGVAASTSDTVLILDELSVMEARDVQAALYALANGAGKARAARDGLYVNQGRGAYSFYRRARFQPEPSLPKIAAGKRVRASSCGCSIFPAIGAVALVRSIMAGRTAMRARSPRRSSKLQSRPMARLGRNSCGGLFAKM